MNLKLVMVTFKKVMIKTVKEMVMVESFYHFIVFLPENLNHNRYTSRNNGFTLVMHYLHEKEQNEIFASDISLAC